MKKLMTHLYWGDPHPSFSLSLARTLVESGADILEIGVPYTDPMCDGPVFQRACDRALKSGTTPLDVFSGISQIRALGYTNPIYLTSYCAPIYAMGIKTWMSRAKQSGVQGMIIPDLLLEEQQDVSRVAKNQGISIIQFATVYSSRERLQQVIDASTDFLYCISLPGVTGDATMQEEALSKTIAMIKGMTDIPVYVGFGIRTAEDVKRICSYHADGVIVGSAIASLYDQSVNTSESDACAAVSDLVRQLSDAR